MLPYVCFDINPEIIKVARFVYVFDALAYVVIKISIKLATGCQKLLDQGT